MKIVKDDIWLWYEKGWTVVVPSNGYINKLDECVMKRGIAFQAKKLFQKLSFAVGALIKQHGSHVFYFERQKLITFPTKHSWRDEKADIKLIQQSCLELVKLWNQFPDLKIAMPKVGCGAGKLEWDEVAPVVQGFFGNFSKDKFVIVDNESGDCNQDFRGKNKENIRGLNAKLEEQIIDLPAPSNE
jgi:hypothetical protein